MNEDLTSAYALGGPPANGGGGLTSAGFNLRRTLFALMLDDYPGLLPNAISTFSINLHHHLRLRF